MIGRNARAIQRVYEDKYKRFQRAKAEQAAAERAAEYQAQKAAEKAEKLEEERKAEEDAYQALITERLEKYRK